MLVAMLCHGSSIPTLRSSVLVIYVCAYKINPDTVCLDIELAVAGVKARMQMLYYY